VIILKKLAGTFEARVKNQGLKGKARDRAALEFFCGAAAALDAAGDKDEAQSVTFNAFLISVRGYEIVTDILKEKEAA